MFGVTLTTDAEIIEYAKKLQAKGAQNVLISMAGDGAILLTTDGTTYKCPAPKGKLVNSVGAGDSMVAGFITGFNESAGDFKTATWELLLAQLLLSVIILQPATKSRLY